jgi:plastocyanin
MLSALRSCASSRWVRIGAAGALMAGAIGLWASTGGAVDKTIRTEGTEDVHINSKIFSNLRFTPGNTTIKSGDSITLSHADDTDEPHTLTIVNAADLPTDTEGVFGCGEPGTICDDAFNAVGGQIVDEAVAQFVNIGGGAGLDARLDTIWLPPGSSITVPVSAPAGTTLMYMCVIHAWMQGTIVVK